MKRTDFSSAVRWRVVPILSHRQFLRPGRSRCRGPSPDKGSHVGPSAKLGNRKPGRARRFCRSLEKRIFVKRCENLKKLFSKCEI